MLTLSDLYRNAVWICVPLLCVSIFTIAFFIRSLVRLVRNAPAIRLPLVAEQPVEFTEAGPMSLCIEGPRFTRRFAGLKFELTTEGGSPVQGRIKLFRTMTSGRKTVRLEVRKYTIPEPGAYVLRIRGLGPTQERDAEHHIVFATPIGAQLFVRVVGIVFGALVFMASLILLVFRLATGPSI